VVGRLNFFECQRAQPSTDLPIPKRKKDQQNVRVAKISDPCQRKQAFIVSQRSQD
jgi:hypothetical protein